MARKATRSQRKRIGEGIVLKGFLSRPVPAPRSMTNLQFRHRQIFSASLLSCALAATGCAGRRPIVSNPPAAPVPTPAGTDEAARRATSSEPKPKPDLAPKRSTSADIPAANGYVEEGNASWYGAPFHGRKASNGETYDMNKLTAAHRTLPFDSMVRVTNLNNGKTTTVRITDRGPFVDNRIIDLSRAAAQEIESIGPGVVPVRIEVVSAVGDVTAGFFTVQVGAFKDKANADRLRERLMAIYPLVFIQTYDSPDGTFYRVRVGKVSGEEEARAFAGQLRQREGFTTLVFRLDDTSGSTP